MRKNGAGENVSGKMKNRKKTQMRKMKKITPSEITSLLSYEQWELGNVQSNQKSGKGLD